MNAQNGRRLLPVALLASLAVGLGACGPDGPDSYTAPAESPDDTVPALAAVGAVVEVRALDNTFIEEVIEVEAGTEVRWENRGRNDHDVVPVAADEEWGIALDAFTPGDSYRHVFATPGTYRYFCTVHGTADVGMVGTVVVR